METDALIRRLTPDDAGRYVEIRRTMLADTPWAFEAALGEDDIGCDPTRLAARLAEDDNAIFAAEAPDGGALLAVAGISRRKRVKIAHRAEIWGVYTRADARGRGLARAVMRAAIDHARTWPGVEIVELGASERSTEAVRLYESLGFVRWGVEPDYVRIDGRSYAEHHLYLLL